MKRSNIICFAIFLATLCLELPAAPNRSSLNIRLRQLASKPVTIKDNSSVASALEELPDSITYRCIACEKETVHKRPEMAIRSSMWQLSLLKHTREQVKEIAKLSELQIELDERPFCSFCSDGKPSDTLTLVVVVEGDEVVNKLEPNDLRLLEAFFKGKNEVDIQRGTNYKSEPLRNYIPRLRQLLLPK